MTSGGLRSLVRIVVSLNRLRSALELEGKLLDVGIIYLGLIELDEHLMLEPIGY